MAHDSKGLLADNKYKEIQDSSSTGGPCKARNIKGRSLGETGEAITSLRLEKLQKRGEAKWARADKSTKEIKKPEQPLTGHFEKKLPDPD